MEHLAVFQVGSSFEDWPLPLPLGNQIDYSKEH